MARAIRIINPAVIALINRRAEVERRSAANAAATTILEALLPIYGEAEDTAARVRRDVGAVKENT